MSLHNKTKPDSYPEPINVNAAGRWNEGYCSYPGRSVLQLAAAPHQPKRQPDVGTHYGVRQKSAEVIVAEH